MYFFVLKCFLIHSVICGFIWFSCQYLIGDIEGWIQGCSEEGDRGGGVGMPLPPSSVLGCIQGRRKETGQGGGVYNILAPNKMKIQQNYRLQTKEKKDSKISILIGFDNIIMFLLCDLFQ